MLSYAIDRQVLRKGPAGTTRVAVRVIHFGVDDCHRLKVLRSAGYTVRECSNLLQLQASLLEDGEAEAVFMSEGAGMPPEAAVLLTRTLSPAPLVLFKGPNGHCNESGFDLVVQTLTPPDAWLEELDALVAQSREIRADAQLLV